MDALYVRHILMGLYFTVLVMVCLYGLHRYQLVYLYYKHRRNTPRIRKKFKDLPTVTVQLPMYNERFVARRIIEKACQIDYPRDKLQIQVLDDSTDETTHIARETVERMRAAGHNIVYLHRDNRQGYKAGALQEGMKSATGEFLCIFDADFIPPPDILKNTIHYFTDPKVGMVQARWDHINRDQSLLTKTQAILLDGHFMIEHAARNRSGRFMSFNGTAGLWRRSCIEDAGGWEHDTLTEDLDLSYRAQMKGWKFIFLPNQISPAELPPEMNAFKAQQHRWAKGGAQTCKKLLPKILRSKLPLKIKVEAFFHLTSCTVYFYIVLLTLLLFPALYCTELTCKGWGRYLFDLSVLVLATCGPSSFYLASQREIFHTWTDKIKYLPFLMSLGLGIALNNAIAAFEGFFGKSSEFVRTPKFGVEQSMDSRWKSRARKLQKKKRRAWQPYLELALGFYMLGCIVISLLHYRVTVGVPFLALFMVGYFYVALMSFYGRRVVAGEAAQDAPDTEPAQVPVGEPAEKSNPSRT